MTDDVRIAKSLAGAIKKHKELSFVNLSSCALGDNAKVLAAVLSGCSGLKSLVLDNNGIKSMDIL